MWRTYQSEPQKNISFIYLGEKNFLAIGQDLGEEWITRVIDKEVRIQAMIKRHGGVRRQQKAFEFMNSHTHQTRDGDPSSPWVCCFGLNFKFCSFAIY